MTRRAIWLAATVAAAAALATPAQAYRLDHHVVPQPTLLYYVALKDWKKPFDRVVKDLNRHHVGVKLKKAQIPEQASIQIGRLEHRCGLPGVDGTTHTISGGYAAIYLPRGCHGKIASIIAAHELGHALGLKHEDRRCALLNSSGTGPDGIPTNCLGRKIDWLHHPFRKDDVRGLRRLFRNTAPKASLRSAGTGPVEAGDEVRVRIAVKDKQHNISELRLDWGDGAAPQEAFSARELEKTHVYTQPGTYTVKLTVIDYYLKRATAKLSITVSPAQ